MQQKSLFSSKTVLFAIATLWFAIAPAISNIADQERWPRPSEWIQIVSLVLSTLGTIYGRYEAGSVYTPTWLPGRNKPEGELPDSNDPTLPPS